MSESHRNETLLSIAIFLGTVLASQYLQRKTRAREEDEATEDDTEFEWYARRRLRHRMSFNVEDEDRTNNNWLHFEHHTPDGHRIDQTPARCPLQKKQSTGATSLGGDFKREDTAGSDATSDHLPTIFSERELDDTPPVSRRQSLVEDAEQRLVRSAYNARIMPHRVLLLRHGQSMGNIDECLYSTTPDNAMPLTPLGWQQAQKAGQLLQSLVVGPRVHFIVSPYVRTVETLHGVWSAWCPPGPGWHETLQEQYGFSWHQDPRIREQDFGNFQEPSKIKQAKKDRQQFGAFYYRFPHGESASDVYDRISTFLDSLWRSFDYNSCETYVIVTHGIAIRVLLARYFRYTVDQFHLLSNPRNCEVVVLEHDGRGKLQFGGRYEQTCTTDSETGETRVDGYRYHKKLKILPDSHVTKARARTQCDE